MRLIAAAPLAAALVLSAWPDATGAAPPARARRASRSAHPDTGGDKGCAACHAQATPEAFGAWRRGKHGEVLVTCVVCHGSTGADFTLRPSADRCAGCHPRQVATMPAAPAAGKGCFACHPAHELSPHGGGDPAGVREAAATREPSVAFPDQGIQSVPLTIQPAPPAQPAGAPAPPAGSAAAPAAGSSAAPAPSGAPEPARAVPATPALPGQPTQDR
jgi:hypothetical protein